MKERARKVIQSVDRLSLRERLFLFAAVLVVLGGAWEALLAGPLEARERVAAQKITALQGRLAQLNDSITVAAEGMSEGMPSQFDRLRALRARAAEGDEAVRVVTSDLVNPAQMRVALEDLISRQTGLELVSATNLAARPLFDEREAGESPGAARGAADEPDTPKLYRHTLVLRLRGSYLDCLAYLQAVERLPWHLYWARLELAAGEYPRNEIVIEVHTLSLDSEWIGV